MIIRKYTSQEGGIYDVWMRKYRKFRLWLSTMYNSTINRNSKKSVLATQNVIQVLEMH